MLKRESKITHAAHIKRNTAGTSNELSFSVLDAAKNALDADDQSARRKGPAFVLGSISLFTLPGKRKTVSTPTKEKGLPLSTGGFASVGSDSSGYSPSLPSGGAYDTTVADSRARAGGLSASEGSSRGGADANAGSYASSWTTPADEVKRKKAGRKRRRFAFFTLVVLLCLAGALSAGSWLYRGYMTQSAYVDDLTSALEVVQQNDASLISLDEDVSAVLNLADGEVLDSHTVDAFPSEKSLSTTAGVLSQTLSAVRGVAENMADSVDKEAANQTIVAVSARLSMIDAGGQILNAYRAAWAATTSALEGWSALLEGDSLAREAAELVTNTTEDNVRASMEKIDLANEKFSEADELFEKAGALYPAADFSGYRAYIAKRIEALGYAQESNRAFLEKNKEDAQSYNDQYNATDTEAAKMAEDFPQTPAFVASDAFNQAISQQRSDYTSVRSQAASADSFLSDYLAGRSA